MQTMLHARVAVWVMAGLLMAGCFSGVKYVGPGEACVSGNQVLAGEVACSEGSTCVPTGVTANNDREGVCFPACTTDAVCAPDRVCAAGACVPPCSSGCNVHGSFGPCCELPDGLSGCLPAAACAAGGGQQPSPTDAMPADADAGS